MSMPVINTTSSKYQYSLPVDPFHLHKKIISIFLFIDKPGQIYTNSKNYGKKKITKIFFELLIQQILL